MTRRAGILEYSKQSHFWRSHPIHINWSLGSTNEWHRPHTCTLMANSVYPIYDTIRSPLSLELQKPSGLDQLCIWLLGKSQLLPWKPTRNHHWEQMKFPPLSLKGARRRNSQHSARLAMHVRAKGNNHRHFFIMTLNIMPLQRVTRRCFSIS